MSCISIKSKMSLHLPAIFQSAATRGEIYHMDFPENLSELFK